MPGGFVRKRIFTPPPQALDAALTRNLTQPYPGNQAATAQYEGAI